MPTRQIAVSGQRRFTAEAVRQFGIIDPAKQAGSLDEMGGSLALATDTLREERERTV